MQVLLAAYQSVLCAWVALGAILIVQFIVADLAGMKAKHVPGMPVTGGHGDVHFRAVRAQANTNETLGLFILLSLAAILAGAAPEWAARGTWLWVIGRAAYTACYYADQRTARSTVFAIGQIGLLVLLVIDVAALMR